MKKGLLRFHSSRPTVFGIGVHLVSIHKLVEEVRPDAVVVDPITNLISIGENAEIKSMMTRVIDFLKNKQITALFTSLTAADGAADQSEVGISSLIDTWFVLQNKAIDGDFIRRLYILKSRGMAYSSEIRPFRLTDNGIRLLQSDKHGGMRERDPKC